MLDETLRVINIPATQDQRLQRLWELQTLDKRLQESLAQLMVQRAEERGLRCGPIATVIRYAILNAVTHARFQLHERSSYITDRSLYLLHQDILYQAPFLSPAVGREDWLESSEAALDTATNMMVDVARHHLRHIARHGVDTLNFCCACNVRVSINHISHRHRHSRETEDVSEGLEALTALERAFSDRWELREKKT